MPGDTSDQAKSEDGIAPAEAFSLVGNETRAAIIRALGRDPHEGIPFSELRDRVESDVEGDIDSGQFNYHLQRLCGQFVEQNDDGYTLRPEGLTLYRTIRAGTFTQRASIEPFEAGFDCYFCGEPVCAAYDDGAFELQCPDCEHVYTYTVIPPGTVDGVDESALLTRVDRYNRHQLLAFSRGVCPICVNTLETTFIPGEEVWASGAEKYDVFVNHSCDHCGNGHHMSVGLAMLYNPTLISFFYERGHDVTTIPHWELEFAMNDRGVTVRSADPWEVALTVTCEGDTLTLVVDGDLNVVDTCVEAASPP